MLCFYVVSHSEYDVKSTLHHHCFRQDKCREKKKEADDKEWMAHVIEDNLSVIHDETGKLHEQFATQTQSST